MIQIYAKHENLWHEINIYIYIYIYSLFLNEGDCFEYDAM